ncbi:MAG: DUF5677 domain-containing protein [Bacilli bacterium]|nr:DUF5677 domain-containing protein [Bacilli bacterium]
MTEYSISKEQFNQLLDAIKASPELSRDFLYECFCDALDSTEYIKEEAPVIEKMNLNPLTLALYLVNEHHFYLVSHPESSQESLIKDEGYEQLLLSLALDKYYTNEHFAFKNQNFANRFDPTISTLSLYLNFILGMLSRYSSGNPNQTLFIDVMKKGFSMAQCILNLLENGYETEAFSTWRTLHENECILQVLMKNGKPVVEAYIQHMKYALAFRGGIPSKEETDAVFLEIKEGMKANDLKSKDMKRFIEYGWLAAIPEVKNGEVPDFKFNFRDGVERCAGLRNYAKVYEMSSEIAHSSPLLIYSRKTYFYLVTILNLYESFFRLEKAFKLVYFSSIPEEAQVKYNSMKNLYYGELLSCYNLQKNRLNQITGNDNKALEKKD